MYSNDTRSYAFVGMFVTATAVLLVQNIAGLLTLCTLLTLSAIVPGAYSSIIVERSTSTVADGGARPTCAIRASKDSLE